MAPANRSGQRSSTGRLPATSGVVDTRVSVIGISAPERSALDSNLWRPVWRRVHPFRTGSDALGRREDAEADDPRTDEEDVHALADPDRPARVAGHVEELEQDARKDAAQPEDPPGTAVEPSGAGRPCREPGGRDPGVQSGVRGDAAAVVDVDLHLLAGAVADDARPARCGHEG